MTPLGEHVRDLYQAVAREDLMTSLQDERALQDKARSDAKMIGDVAGTPYNDRINEVLKEYAEE